MENKKPESIDELLKNLSFEPKEKDLLKGKEGKVFSMLVPEDYKNRYDRLQAATNLKLGKVIKELFMKVVDQAELVSNQPVCDLDDAS